MAKYGGEEKLPENEDVLRKSRRKVFQMSDYNQLMKQMNMTLVETILWNTQLI